MTPSPGATHFEWLWKRSMNSSVGKDSIIHAAITNAIADYKFNRTIHAIYDRKIKENALVISMGENVTGTLRDSPEEGCEWFRQYLGVVGRPLWYDVFN